MRKTCILHIIDRLSLGGAARAMLNHARETARIGNYKHQILSLLPAEQAAIRLAEQNSCEIYDAPKEESITKLITSSDIIHIHFYNTPALHRFLMSEKPHARKLLWMHVSGIAPPQVLPSYVAEQMDHILVTTPYSLESCDVRHFPNLRRPTRVVFAGADFSRLKGFSSREHKGFNVGYIGTLDPIKMHPSIIEMSAAINVADIHFFICGYGPSILRKKAEELKQSHKFSFLGYVENIEHILEKIDVFGYPLCPGNYATADQSLQEAMYAGIPPVIFNNGATRSLVKNRETGIVVRSDDEYIEAVRWLAEHPEERKRIGMNARTFALDNYGVERTAPLLSDDYQLLMSYPKSSWARSINAMSGAEIFIKSIGSFSTDFEMSMHGDENEKLAADARIANSSQTLASAAAGGILHYAAFFPRDPFLRMWSGLYLANTNQRARAILEFRKALEHGGNPIRIQRYLEATASALGVSDSTMSALRRDPHDAP